MDELAKEKLTKERLTKEKLTMDEGTTYELEKDELANFVDGPGGVDVIEGESKKGKKGKKGASKGEKTPKPKKEPKPKRDNLAYIEGLDSIRMARKTHQIAIAKRAKSIDRPDAVARYDIEIEKAKEKLEALLAKAAESADPIKTLLEMDEEPNKVLTHFILQQEKDFVKWVEGNDFEVPKSALKGVSDDIPDNFLDELPLDLHDRLVTRYENSDFRLRSICRKVNFINEVEGGRITYDKGKWIKESPEVPGEEISVEITTEDTPSK